MKLINRLITVVFLVTFISTAYAADKKAGSGPNPYRDCGIGAALFTDTAWAAVTSNVIWDLGLTALTSATSSPETCSGRNIQTAQFIIDNYGNLIEESAKGEGENLSAVLDIQGCGAAHRSTAVSQIRDNISIVINSDQYLDQELAGKASDLYLIVTSAALTSCSV